MSSNASRNRKAKFSIFLPEEQVRALDSIAQTLGFTTRSKVTVLAVDEFIQKIQNEKIKELEDELKQKRDTIS